MLSLLLNLSKGKYHKEQWMICRKPVYKHTSITVAASVVGGVVVVR
jgi:hypothetical protein